MRYVPAREAARSLGVSSATLRRWADAGKIGFHRTPGGQRRYDVETFLGGRDAPATIVYAHVSNHGRRQDLDRQVRHLRTRYPDGEVCTDVGAALDTCGGMQSILQRLRDGARLRLVIDDRSRLQRFGFDIVAWLVEANGGEVTVYADRAADTRPHTPVEAAGP